MPRIVNHDLRREELAQHVWELIRREGIGGVTIRNLAQQSGWSSGAIRHYLPDRESILAFAAEQLNTRAEQRGYALPLTGYPFTDFQQLLHLFLPLDDETRLWMEVWLAYLSAAVREESYADTHGILFKNISAVLRQFLTEFARYGWLPHHTPEQAATELHALVDGLSIHLLLKQITPEQARDTLDAALERMLVEPKVAHPPSPPAQRDGGS